MFEDDATNINDVEKALSLVNIKIRDSATSFRPLGDVFDELAPKWKTLEETEQSAIANALAGIRQRENFLTLMSNYNIVLEQQAIQTDAAGLASQRYTIYMQSLEAASNQLKTAWQEMWSKSVTQDMIKDILNAITSIIELISGSGGLIPVLTMGVGAFIAFKNTTIAVSAATGAMGLSFSTALGPIGLVVAAIGLAIIAYNNLHKSAQEIKADMEEGKSTLEENTKELENIKARYEELSQKQNKNRDDLKELVEMQNTVNLKYQAAKEGIDLYTSAVDNNSEAIQKNIDKLDDQIKKEAERYLKVNKPGYQEAQSYLAETEYIAPSGIMGNVVGENVSKQDYLDYLAEQISLYGDYNGRLKDEYDRISENIKIYQEIIDIYNEYSSILSGNTVALDENYDAGIGAKTALAELGQVAEEVTESLEDQFDALAEASQKSSDAVESSLSSLQSIEESYYKNGELTLAQASELINMGYAEALMIDTKTGKISINAQALHYLVIASAEAAAADAQLAYIASAAIPAHEAETAALYKKWQVLTGIAGKLKALPTTSFSIPAFSSSGGGSSISAQEKLNNLKKEAYQQEIKAVNAQKKAAQEEIKALQDKKDAFNDIIDAQKESLRLTKEEDDYQKELEEKNKELADIDAELIQLQFDNSEEGNARRLELEEQRAEKTADIAEYQADRTYDIQIEALDREADAYARMIDQQIAGVNTMISGFDAMIAKINEMIDALGRLANAGSGSGGTSTSKPATTTKKYVSTTADKAKFDATAQQYLNQYNHGPAGFADGGSFETSSEGLIRVHPNEIGAVLNKSQISAAAPLASFFSSIMKSAGQTPQISSNGVGGNAISVGDMIFNVAGNLDKSNLPDIKEMIMKTITDATRNTGTLRNAKSFSV